MPADVMRLRVVTPTALVVDEAAAKVGAEDVNGSFTLLPRHIDLVTELVPGLLTFTDGAGTERLLAVDRGILVKAGDEVDVACGGAFPGDQVLTLQRQLRDAFIDVSDRERRSRAALLRLESDVTTRLIQLEADD